MVKVGDYCIIYGKAPLHVFVNRVVEVGEIRDYHYDVSMRTYLESFKKANDLEVMLYY